MERHDSASREEAPSVGRRRFVRWLGLGSLVAGFAGALGGLNPDGASAQVGKPPAATPPPPAPPAPAPPSDEARALHAVLSGRYGNHLDAAQSEALLGALEQTVQSGKALRGRALANAIEPDTVFRAEPPRRHGEAAEGAGR